MTTEPPRYDIKKLWREQETEGTAVSLEEIQKKADRFYRRSHHRNLREYIATAIVVAAFAFFAWEAPGWMGKIGSVLTIVAALFVVWQLYRRGAARTPPQSGSAMDLLDCHLHELTRQRDALKSVWRWYLAPFVPGMVMLLAGFYFQSPPAPGRTIEWHHQFILLFAVFMVLLFVAVWLLNALAAARWQREIDALEKVRSE
jgi:Flp pilus assembly protein TadB